jgi:hypothetical protein
MTANMLMTMGCPINVGKDMAIHKYRNIELQQH